MMNNLELMTKGFNAGFLLEKHNPELSRTILKGFADKNIPFAKGYIAGVKEYTIERTKEHFRNKSKERDKGQDFDIGR